MASCSTASSILFSRTRARIRLLGALLAGGVLLAAVLLVGIVYMFLPVYFEQQTAASLKAQYATRGEPEVVLRRDPTSLLSRSYTGGSIVLPAGDFGGVRPERVVVELEPFQVDLLNTVTTGQTSTARPISGTLTADLTEQEVGRIVRESGTAGDGSFPILGVDLDNGLMVVRSETVFLGQPVPVTAEGNLRLQDGALTFEPGRFEAMGMEVPGRLGGQSLGGTSFAYRIEDLPTGVEIGGAEIRGETLVLSGRVEGLRI